MRVYAVFRAGRIIDAIHSSTIAPAIEQMMLPKVPAATHPNHENIHPPSSPPTRPTIRLTISPDPLPLTIRLAIQPENRPISKYHKKNITKTLKRFIHCFVIHEAMQKQYPFWSVFMPRGGPAFAAVALLPADNMAGGRFSPHEKFDL